jgi:hypothetical protein
MNTNNPILGPAGAPMFAMGHQAHAQFEAGDYCVSIEWHNDGRSSEPIMVIWSKHSADGGALGICLSSIGGYVEPDGRASPNGLRNCWRALPTLGRNQIDMEAFRLMDVIVRHTPDLIRCPPAPADVRKADVGAPMWEVTHVNHDGKRIGEALI